MCRLSLHTIPITYSTRLLLFYTSYHLPLLPITLYYCFLIFLLHFLHYFLDADAAFPRLLDLDTGHASPVLLLRYYPPPLYHHYLQYTCLLLLLPCVYCRSRSLRTPWHPCIRSDRHHLAVLGFAPLFSSSYPIPPLQHYLPDFYRTSTHLAHPGIVASLQRAWMSTFHCIAIAQVYGSA